MKMMLSFLLFSSLWLQAHSQQFGGFPSRTKWKQINTDTSRIIFTAEAEEEAQRVATIINAMAARDNPLGKSFNKINVLLQSNTTQANGYVALAPFRSEFYLVPGGNIFEFGNLPWQEQLAIHEYRHVQQYNNFNRGLSKGFGVLFGQEGRALANALSVPDWFFEGDAVYAETILSPQGRGRMPYFHNGYKALWREGKDYSWMKLRNGSLKDYVPNHYQLGYLLVNYGYLKYGDDFWGKVTADASAFKGLLYPFQKAVKRHAGVDFKNFRRDALNYYKHEVSKRRSDQMKKETVTNFYFAYQVSPDSVIYLKESYKKIPAFYLSTKRGEKKIRQKSIGSEEWFSYRNGVIAYTAYKTDPRWSLIDYSDIVLLDIHTGKEKWLTQKGRYYSPDISSDNNTVLAVSVSDSVKSELHLLDAKGKVLQTFQAATGTFFVQPRFIDNATAVVIIRRADATLSMEKLDLKTGSYQPLIQSATTLGHPFVHNNEVFFISSLTGNDEVYHLQLKGNKVFQLTNGQGGKYYVTVGNDSIRYSQFTTNGMRMQQSGIQGLTPIEVNPIMWNESMLPLPLAKGEQARNILNIPTRTLPVSRYKKSTGLFDFHSWRPDYEPPEFTFSVFSDNILATFSNQLYYRYNQNERSHTTGFTAFYGGWYPMLSAGAAFTKDRHIKRQNQTTLTIDQTEANIGYNIPLNFTQGRTFKFLNFGSAFHLSDVRPTGATKAVLKPFQTTYLRHSIRFSQQLQRARQHIFPRAGYALSTDFRHRLDEYGYQRLHNGNLFLPSPFTNHNIVLTGSMQQTDTSNVLFSNRFINARGYTDFYFSKMWRGSVNYHMPLAYPDFGIGNIVYLLRLRSNVFYDQSRMFSNNRKNTLDLRSAGTELFFDTKWWNALPVTFGVRYSYLLDSRLVGRSSPHVFEFIIPIDLIPN